VHIHNQCSGFELISPVYFGLDVVWNIPTDQKVDVNAKTRVSFAKSVTKHEFENALIYRLQRKRIEANDQFNADNTLTEDTSTYLQLLVIWGFSEKWEKNAIITWEDTLSYSSSVRALLIKHSNTITWNEDTLEKLRYMYLSLLRDDKIVKDTWLLDDTTVLMTTSEQKMGHAIEITISEGTKEDGATEPLWVSSNM
jgi:hypothetical protein